MSAPSAIQVKDLTDNPFELYVSGGCGETVPKQSVCQNKCTCEMVPAVWLNLTSQTTSRAIQNGQCAMGDMSIFHLSII